MVVAQAHICQVRPRRFKVVPFELGGSALGGCEQGRRRGWHGTTALDTRTGTLHAVWTRYGTATLWRGIARARPGAVLYLERSERLRADGRVYECPPPQPVKKLGPPLPRGI